MYDDVDDGLEPLGEPSPPPPTVNWPDDHEAQREAVWLLLKAGVRPSDVLRGGLSGVMALAGAGSLSVQDAASVAGTAIAEFALAGDPLPRRSAWDEAILPSAWRPPAAPDRRRKFQAFGTGHPVPDEAVYVSTHVLMVGELVLHLFEVA